MFKLSGNILPLDTPFEHDGILYPANWLRLTTLEEKQAIGIEEVPDPVSYDLRFFNANGTDRDLNVVKQELVSQVKTAVGEMMQRTDWYIIRKLDRGVDVPNHITQYRAAVLEEGDRMMRVIQQAKKIDQLAVVMDTNRWADVESILDVV